MASIYNSNNIKKLLCNIQSSHNPITNKKNVTSTLNTLRQTFVELDNGLRGQTAYIKELNLHTSTEAGQQLEKPSQQKRMLLKMIDMTYEEITQFVEVFKEIFSIGLKDKKQTNSWDKVLMEMSKKLEALKATILPNNMFQIIFKLLNMRDDIMKQFLRGIIYQKHLLWLDLKIPYESYIHHEIQSILDVIKTSPQKYGFVPSKIQFNMVSPSDQGRWSILNDKSESTIPSALKLVILDVKEMIETVKNYSKLNETSETFEDINKNKVVVKGLREKIEQHCINYNILLDKYRSVQAKDNDTDIKSKLDFLHQESAKKDNEISLLQTTLSASQSSNSNLKDKLKQTEEELLKLNVSYYPKLKQVQALQKSLLQQFFKLKKDLDGVSTSLENESEVKSNLRNQVKQQKQLANNLVNILGRERRKIKDFKQEIKKLQMLVFELTNKHFAE